MTTIQTAKCATLTVRLSGFKNDDGTAIVALTNAEGFLRPNGAVHVQSVPIHDRLAVCVFTNIPYGKFAVEAFHDLNNNSRLDTNFLGIPKEPYGFSNDARGSFGAPKYEQAEFSLVTPSLTIEIHIR